jgi:hypothetical protein
MEKRSRRRIRDLVALTAIQGLSQNEIGCARISIMARSRSAPFKGRIQKRKTNHLQIIISSLQRTADPYKSANTPSWAYRPSRSVASFANGVRQPVSLSAGDMPRVCVKLRERADMSALCGLGEYFYEPLPPGRVRRSPRKVSLGLGI